MVAEQFSGQFNFSNGCWAILPAMTFLKEENAENFDGVEECASKARISFRNLNLQIFKYPIQWKYTETIMFLYYVRRGHHPPSTWQTGICGHQDNFEYLLIPAFYLDQVDLGGELRNSWIFLSSTGQHNCVFCYIIWFICV